MWQKPSWHPENRLAAKQRVEQDHAAKVEVELREEDIVAGVVLGLTVAVLTSHHIYY